MIELTNEERKYLKALLEKAPEVFCFDILPPEDRANLQLHNSNIYTKLSAKNILK